MVIDESMDVVDLLSPADSDQLCDATYDTEASKVKLDVFHACARIETPRHHPF